ncbi:MAG: low molecular weight protein-tyrosine-phosphatase [Bacteroidota bacterium]
MKILMVCLGNICRSPLAEGIMKAQIRTRQLAWIVDSAGTSGWHEGELPDPRSIEEAQQHGIDITDQRSRKILPTDLDEFDLILAMDASNYNDLRRLATTDTQRSKIKMIMNMVAPGQNQNVPDPYYDNGFPKVYNMLESACLAIVDQYADTKS